MCPSNVGHPPPPSRASGLLSCRPGDALWFPKVPSPRKTGHTLLYLVNDSRARPPEAHAILGTRSCQEIIHFLVYVLVRQIDNQSMSTTVWVWDEPCSPFPPHDSEMLALRSQVRSWRASPNHSKRAWMSAQSQLAGLGSKARKRFCDTWPESASGTSPFPTLISVSLFGEGTQLYHLQGSLWHLSPQPRSAVRGTPNRTI